MRGDKRFACECFMRMYGFRRGVLLNLNKKDHVASHENIDEANLVEADNLGSVCGSRFFVPKPHRLCCLVRSKSLPQRSA